MRFVPPFGIAGKGSRQLLLSLESLVVPLESGSGRRRRRLVHAAFPVPPAAAADKRVLSCSVRCARFAKRASSLRVAPPASGAWLSSGATMNLFPQPATQ